MTTYTPGQRVHVKCHLYYMDEDATYVEPANHEDKYFEHVILIDQGRELFFKDSEVTPIAEPKTLIESADWGAAVTELGKMSHAGPGIRYTIIFEENEA